MCLRGREGGREGGREVSSFGTCKHKPELGEIFSKMLLGVSVGANTPELCGRLLPASF